MWRGFLWRIVALTRILFWRRSEGCWEASTGLSSTLTIRLFSPARRGVDAGISDQKVVVIGIPVDHTSTQMVGLGAQPAPTLLKE